MMSSGNGDHEHAGPNAATNRWLVIVLMLLVGVLLFRTVSDAISNRHNYSPRTVTARGDLASDEKATIEVFRQAAPSVVFIRTKGYVRTMLGAEQMELASGTGFVWDENGHIVTNLHVVREAVLERPAQLEVQLQDGTFLDAEFIGAVYEHDVAVLKVDAPASRLQPITLGTSDDLQVGQKVLAIGNPFGFDHTLSAGVIGGLNRAIMTNEGSDVLAGLIQTDAAINPGNSGGPLLDSAGRLIGVNTAIVSSRGDSAGLGFAVPVAFVMESVERVLAAAGIPQPPQLGIGVFHRDDLVQYGLPDDIWNRGPIINNVVPNSSAADAGLRPWDQITAIDGVAVGSVEDLKEKLAAHMTGDVVEIDIIRRQQQGTVTVTLKAPRLIF